MLTPRDVFAFSFDLIFDFDHSLVWGQSPFSDVIVLDIFLKKGNAFLGTIQKLRNGQRGRGNRRFCYISLRKFQGEGVVNLRQSYVTADNQFENSKSPV